MCTNCSIYLRHGNISFVRFIGQKDIYQSVSFLSLLLFSFFFFFLISFLDPPPVLRVDDRQRLARERREEREKQLGNPSPHWTFQGPRH